MNRETLFLKIAVFLIAAPVLALALLGIPWLATNPANPVYARVLYPIIAIMYLSTVPFFVALYQSFKLLSYIDKNEAFSDSSVKTLKKIKFCAMIISVLYVGCWPFVLGVAELDDAPGLAIVGMVPIFASMVIAVFAAVLEKLLAKAIAIKSENELTI
ncbi:Protein of unknown function (DUF3036) [Desulfitobacterium dichloroeliminans LMG P-21439]|uniref:DUF2975 domain-containing protein n=1 Tax=Desulfitobacterium dichloroeliminans (strain LMG P-21439 / DCA1) TaxID=871963 RepID=L0F1U1_DESDL|nr:DUF2975 domain-containing protein [Desulfitobacterium dichloroeliminans]AGA67829.1 Protein of unknown function (DUF3036) [Desulfitobacterium dichloroeliminans LMG P-21439]